MMKPAPLLAILAMLAVVIGFGGCMHGSQHVGQRQAGAVIQARN